MTGLTMPGLLLDRYPYWGTVNMRTLEHLIFGCFVASLVLSAFSAVRNTPKDAPNPLERPSEVSCT